jgi:hypothetical protein
MSHLLGRLARGILWSQLPLEDRDGLPIVPTSALEEGQSRVALKGVKYGIRLALLQLQEVR